MLRQRRRSDTLNFGQLGPFAVSLGISDVFLFCSFVQAGCLIRCKIWLCSKKDYSGKNVFRDNSS